MDTDDIRQLYRRYIDLLNARDWAHLGALVDAEVVYNGERIGLSGYRAMLEADVRAIPDLRFHVERLACEPPTIASRLSFDCTPAGELFGYPVFGRRIRFAENVFYEVAAGKIRRVWSVIDKAAIADQLDGRPED